MADTYKILITGGAGYIGSILVPHLINLGHTVTVLDNFIFKQNSLSHVCVEPKFQIVRGDARDISNLRPLTKDADIIVPLAALVGAPLCDTDVLGASSTNYEAIKTLLSLLSKEQKVLIPITNSGYGVGEKDKLCDEETPLRPITHYGKTKVQAESCVLERGNAISFRLATVFGMAPRMRLDLLVNDFVYRAVNDNAVVLFESHFKRNYIHIRDVSRAFVHAIDNFEKMENEAYNVGLSDANLSKWELCEKIKKYLPKFVFMDAPIGEDPDKRDYIISNKKIEKLGFKTQYSLEDGIMELIKGYKMIRNASYGNI
tara:strand:- start:570 stop:1514 length:945 start_codon:yes stop_codon:yes gene_type:complete